MDAPTTSRVNVHINGVKKAVNNLQTPIHPTQSLQFLRKLNSNTQSRNQPPVQAKLPLRVIIVGAGLGGLACAIALARRGYTCTVLEQAAQLGEVSYGMANEKRKRSDIN